MEDRAAIGIFGGAFDPVHIGHVAVAEAALRHLGIGVLILVPTGTPPHKTDHPLAPAQHRIAMLARACEKIPRTEISHYETERPGPSYSADTLRYFRTLYPERKLYFVVGDDSLADLPEWRNPAEIFALATLAVYERAGTDPEKMGRAERVFAELPDAVGKIERIGGAPLSVASSEIRRKIAAGLKPDGITDDTYAYILRHGLYGAGGEGGLCVR